MLNYFIVLGIKETASEKEITDSFQKLSEKLNSLEIKAPSAVQKDKCIAKIKEAYDVLKNQKTRDEHLAAIKASTEQGHNIDLTPKLGQICLEAGMITLSNLEEALAEQKRTGLPLGHILQEKQLISQAELDGLLLGLELLQEEEIRLDALSKRLLLLDLISLDMITVGLKDQRTSKKSLPELMIAHGWLDEKLLAALK